MERWTREQIEALLDENVIAVEKAIVRLYNVSAFRKDPSQKGWGMSRFDYEINPQFGNLYHKIMNINFDRPYGERMELSEERLEKLRKRIKKYAGQLTKIANGEDLPELLEGVRDYEDPPSPAADRLIPYTSDKGIT